MRSIGFLPLAGVVTVVLVWPVHAQTTKPIPRPPAQKPGADIAPGGISFYTGKLFSRMAGQPVRGRTRGEASGAAGASGRPRRRRRERLLTELDMRIRDVKEGPDGALYVLTDRDGGRLLRLVPAPLR